MKVEITMSQLYSNNRLLKFFFRTQSENTLNDLLDSVEESNRDVFYSIENYSIDLDEIEELFYNESIEELIYIFGLTKIEEEEEEE